jgi:hypothetical protein
MFKKIRTLLAHAADGGAALSSVAKPFTAEQLAEAIKETGLGG